MSLLKPDLIVKKNVLALVISAQYLLHASPLSNEKTLIHLQDKNLYS